ncbi:hypothetical protein N5T98_06765 [Aliarcobacter cryaerophilus]|uniref:hypothetical protein n=1 Tax=Aliarcobacter cryaerophilus TaxID=28198 RepID=UPI0021B6ACC8|nr:hypothetical protein [Aliarcobacter cryaerophilus]MCT7486723.1 hypothetical protein [Aliarcobacter cryaerophilus]MCT7490788.1 hypothetical protein [Aliarcobacter cryaerophilus]
MISPIQTGKTYGVLHTESFFSFLGFAKKIGSDETQKIDVFLDDKLIDTIEANEFIQKIDDMYDVENKAFTYNLPTQYMGKKAIISFKNHDSGEELLNSPYTLIDKNHEKFNEAKFLHSISEPLSEELKNMYKPNTIGFLATKENMEDEEFVEYINELMERFPEVEFYIYPMVNIDYLRSKIKLFKLKINLESNPSKFLKNLRIFIHNNEPNSNYTNVSNLIMKKIQTTYVLYYSSDLFKNKTINDYVLPKDDYYLNTLLQIGIDNNKLEFFDYNYEKILNNYLFEICNYSKYEITNDFRMDFLKNYIQVDLALKCNIFIEKIYLLRKIHLKF